MNKAGHSTSVYLLPGMSVEIVVPGFFIESKNVMHTHEDGTRRKRKLLNGYLVDDETVGEITAINDKPRVTYKHKKFSKNVIVFYALTTENSYVYVISVPIHDHASIVSGGPAYGSYFSDDQTVTDETE